MRNGRPGIPRRDTPAPAAGSVLFLQGRQLPHHKAPTVPDVAHDAVARKPRREFNPGTSGADTKRDHRAEEQRTSRSASAAASSSRRSLREGDCNASVGGYGFKPGLLHHDAAAVADAPDDAAGRKLNDRCRTKTVFLNLCRFIYVGDVLLHRVFRFSLPLHFQPLPTFAVTCMRSSSRLRRSAEWRSTTI